MDMLLNWLRQPFGMTGIDTRRLHVASLAATAGLLALLTMSATAQSTDSNTVPQMGRPLFKTGIDLVALNVIVTDGQNNYVTGLAQQDFAVYEDGVQQDISYFADAAAPLDLAILLDVSASMTERMAFVRETAIGFLKTLRAGDRGMVVAFNRTVNVLAPLTGDLPALAAAVGRTTPEGGTSLYNAIYVTLKELAREGRNATEVRRQAIVVLSDGEDTASRLTFDQVLDQAKRSNTSVYTIMMRSGVAAPGRRGYFSTAQFEMKTLALESGARTFGAQKPEDLSGVYGSITEELAHQYAIGYISKNQVDNGRFRRIVVRVQTSSAAQPRSRTGYYVASDTRVALD